MAANETRLAGAALVSLAAHLALLGAVLTWLARPPVYRTTPADETPPWLVRLVPPPPPPTRDARPRASAHRPLRVLAKPATERDDATPVVTTVEPGEGAASPAGPSDGGGDEVTPEKVRRALRSGMVGCANADRLGLNRQERAHCADVMGKDMGAIQRAMRDAEQNRLSLGGEPPNDYKAFTDACRARRQGSGQAPRAQERC